MRYIGCRVEAFGKGTTTQRDPIYHLDLRHYLPFLCGYLQRDPLFYQRKGKPFAGIIPQGSGGIEPIPPLPFICDQETTPVDEEPNPEPNLPGTPPNPDPNWPIERCWCPCIIPFWMPGLINGHFCSLLFESIPDLVKGYPFLQGWMYFDRQFTCCDQFGFGIQNILRWAGECISQIYGDVEQYLPYNVRNLINLCIQEALCDLCTALSEGCKTCPQQTNPQDVCKELCEIGDPAVLEIIRQIIEGAEPALPEVLRYKPKH
jgi:hypothetical protein